MKFSIVIPVYNSEKFIGKAIESVLNQTYADWELIIINDGSTDLVEEVVRKYIKKNDGANIRFISQANKGLGAARNTGIKSAKGEYIALLDADDVWYQGKLKAVNEILLEENDLDVVCHDEYLVKQGGGVRKRLNYGPKEACSYQDLLFKENVLSGSATTIRKEKLFEVGLFSENKQWHGVEDYDMWLKLSKIDAKFFFLNEVYGEYVMHSNNMTNNATSFVARVFNVIDYHFEQWPNKSLFYRYLFKKRKAKICQGTAIQLLKAGEPLLAGRQMIKSLFL